MHIEINSAEQTAKAARVVLTVGTMRCTEVLLERRGGGYQVTSRGLDAGLPIWESTRRHSMLSSAATDATGRVLRLLHALS